MEERERGISTDTFILGVMFTMHGVNLKLMSQVQVMMHRQF